MAAQHVSIEASGFLFALVRHLMLTRHARANAKVTFPAVPAGRGRADLDGYGSALSSGLIAVRPAKTRWADRPVVVVLHSSRPPGRPRRLVCRAIWCAG